VEREEVTVKLCRRETEKQFLFKVKPYEITNVQPCLRQKKANFIWINLALRAGRAGRVHPISLPTLIKW
jgi:hypothetical protein